MTGDALEMLFNSFRSPDPTSGAGVDNYGGYRNPDLDQSIAEALRQLDAASRLPALQRGLGMALADVALGPPRSSAGKDLDPPPFADVPPAGGRAAEARGRAPRALTRPGALARTRALVYRPAWVPDFRFHRRSAAREAVPLMTIARRLLILLGVPLLALATIGFFLWRQLAAIEDGTLTVAEKRTESLQLVGNISRGYTEGRVLRQELPPRPDAGGEELPALASFAETRKEVAALLERYGDAAISGDRDRRFYDEYRRLSGEWAAGAERSWRSRSRAGSRRPSRTWEGARRRSARSWARSRPSWIRNNEEEAKRAGSLAAEAIEASRRRLLVSTSLGLLFSAIVGILTFRRIATPIRALQETVETIAAGDYSRSVPFTGASDETGALARSIDVLKGGASAMEDQRWVKAGVARLAGEVQEADSLAELGERLVSGLVPLLGGGVAALTLRSRTQGLLRRIAAFGLGDGGAAGESFRAGRASSGSARGRRSRSHWRASPRTTS